ncbi:MAG TPA: nitroreductase family protein [Fimbriimonas sp.]
MNVSNAVATRRATPSFDESVRMPKGELLRLMNEACLAPSSLNLQPWRFLICETEEEKQRLHEASFRQRKILQASAIVVVLGDLKHHENAPRIADGNVVRGYLAEQGRDEWVQRAYEAYSENAVRSRDEAFRGGSLWAMTFMLLAKGAGWDTAPMGGFEPTKLAETFRLEERYLPVLLVAIGKLNPEVELKPRGERLTAEELVLNR